MRLFWILLGAACAYALDLRRGVSADAALVQRTLREARMNFLGVKIDRFLVARGDGPDEDILGFGQVKPLSSRDYELSSVYVFPEHRRTNVGSALVERLVEEHFESWPRTDLFLLTLQPTVPFYTGLGFQELPSTSLPPALAVEYQLGAAISLFLKNNIVAMRYKNREAR